MSPVAFGLILAFVSALTTSFAHALLKAGEDKLAVQAWVRLTELALALPLAIWIGLPPEKLWPWLIGAGLIHAVYQYVLIYSYGTSDFSVAFPIARGATPVFTAALGIGLLGDKLSPLVLAGVVIISLGILSLGRAGSISKRGFLAATFAGLLTTTYTLVDARGVRLAPAAPIFIIWFFVADGLSMPVLLLIRDKGRVTKALSQNWQIGILAGFVALAAFVPALFAFDLAPVGAVAAIRETSVIISLAIAALLLKEEIDTKRLGGALLVTAGAIAIIVGSA